MTRRLLAVGLLALLTLPAVTPRIYASDEVECFAFLRSLTFDHEQLTLSDNAWQTFVELPIEAPPHRQPRQ